MRIVRLVAAAGVLAAAGSARAADTWYLDFSNGSQDLYFEIADVSTTPYVAFFRSSWDDLFKGPAYPDTPQNSFANVLVSSASLSSTGGQIDVWATGAYDGFYDGYYDLTLTYTLSNPQPVGGVFSDANITGLGSYQYYINVPGVQYFVQVSSPTDISGAGPLSFSGVVASVPEPATWAFMIFGFGLMGVGLRRRLQDDGHRVSKAASAWAPSACALTLSSVVRTRAGG